MDIVFTVVFGFAGIILLYVNGWFDFFIELFNTIKALHKTMKELNITPEMINQYASMMNSGNINELMSNMMNNDISKTCISKSGKCMHIYYDYLGKEYMVTVPYSGSCSVDMIQYEMNAIYEDGDQLKITQQPGIPYLVSADNLGCKMMKAINHETDVFHEYKNNTVPIFCTEICDS